MKDCEEVEEIRSQEKLIKKEIIEGEKQREHVNEEELRALRAEALKTLEPERLRTAELLDLANNSSNEGDEGDNGGEEEAPPAPELPANDPNDHEDGVAGDSVPGPVIGTVYGQEEGDQPTNPRASCNVLNHESENDDEAGAMGSPTGISDMVNTP